MRLARNWQGQELPSILDVLKLVGLKLYSNLFGEKHAQSKWQLTRTDNADKRLGRRDKLAEVVRRYVSTEV